MKSAANYSRESLSLAMSLNDISACAALARQTYPHSRRGMWRSVQAAARRVIKAAEKHGLTVDQPTVEKDGMIWALSFWGDVAFVPYCEAESELAE